MSNMPDINKQQEANNNGIFEAKADSGFTQVLRRRWDGTIDVSLANIPLLACCFITGLLDTTMFQGEETYARWKRAGNFPNLLTYNLL